TSRACSCLGRSWRPSAWSCSRRLFPGVTRVAVLLEAASPIKPTVLRALEPMGQELGVTLQLVEVHGPDDFERAFSAIAHGDAEALVVAAQPLLDRHAERIRDFMVAQRLPTIGGERPYLIAYRN